MNRLKNMKVMERLIVLIAALSVAIIAVGGVGYYALNKTNTALQDMYSRVQLPRFWFLSLLLRWCSAYCLALYWPSRLIPDFRML